MDEILTRINLIINKEGLSPSTFADSLEIGRPLLSHVLSGRNKPSLQLILKILEKYPAYSANWLLLGKEESILQTPENYQTEKKETQAIKPPEPTNRTAIAENIELLNDTILVMHADKTYTQFKPRK